MLGIRYKTVARWVRAAGKPGGLNAKPRPAPASGLSDADLRKLVGLLAKGAKAHGRHHHLWTAARVARLIEREFRISYHPEHVRKILKRRLGWTSRKPRRKARDRDDKEVARWRVLAISCIPVSPTAGRPGLYFDPHDHNVRGEDVVAFLAGLHRRLGPVTVVRDRNSVHSKSKAVRAWLVNHPDVVCEGFSGYVPDLNPDEGVWGWAKYGRLANLAAHDKDELWGLVADELVEVKFRPDLLSGFVRETRFPGLSRAA